MVNFTTILRAAFAPLLRQNPFSKKLLSQTVIMYRKIAQNTFKQKKPHIKFW